MATPRHAKGSFDLSRAEWHTQPPGGDIEIGTVDGLIGMRLAGRQSGPILVFTPSEWDAFIAGVRDGEFDPGTLTSSFQSGVDPQEYG